MTPAIVNALKLTSIAALAGLVQWVIVYTHLEPWWRSRVGRSLVYLALLNMVLPALFILSLFFDLNRQTSEVLAWTLVGVLALTAVTMGWRTVLWVRASKEERDGSPE